MSKRLPGLDRVRYDEADVQRMTREGLQGECRLPAPPFLMLDRVMSIAADGGDSGRGHVHAEKDLAPDEWFFRAHFTNDPVMPGSLGVEALLQLCGLFLSWSGASGQARALAVGETVFDGMIRPHHSKVRYELSVRRLVWEPVPLVIADGVVILEGKTIYTVRGMKVGVFDLPYPIPAGA